MINVGNLYGGYSELPFILANAGNLDANLWGYFELSFITLELGNLEANL